MATPEHSELSADEKTRAEYEYRLKARRDAKWIMESAVEMARDEGRQEILNLLKSGISLDEIIGQFNNNNGNTRAQ